LACVQKISDILQGSLAIHLRRGVSLSITLLVITVDFVDERILTMSAF